MQMASDGTARAADSEAMWRALLARRGGVLRPLPPAADGEAQALADLFGPLTEPPAAADGIFVSAHLAQSLDGRIATLSGASRWISGKADLAHTHRLRALAHAVLVGAGTVHHDDPRLTTRLVEGENPVRLVLDPERRLGPDHAVFQDGASLTLLVCAEDRAGPPPPGRARLLPLPRGSDGVDLTALLAALRSLGLTHLFVEGGGVTIGRFLAAGLIDRLHVAVAPLLIGSGIPSLSLPPIDRPEQGVRFPLRVVRLGGDLLFDCALERRRPAWS